MNLGAPAGRSSERLGTRALVFNIILLAWHGVVLDLSPATSYHTKYRVFDREIHMNFRKHENFHCWMTVRNI